MKYCISNFTHCQYRHPRSKKKRIRKKYKNNKNNWKEVEICKIHSMLCISENYCKIMGERVMKSLEEKIIKAAMGEIC